MKKHNFSAGPCILPQEVFKQASEAVLNFNNLDLSILEISHRSKDFVDVMEEARELVLELMGLEGKGYKALFLQGGASMQFVMTAYNLLENKAGYINTGTWSDKAIKEAKIFGEVVDVASSKDKNYNYIPKGFEVPSDLDYLHLTTNNTIFGTQIKEFPTTDVPLVADMSSDIFSREIDFSKFDLIYAGAQKNMGPAGTTLVVIKEDILGKVTRQIPSMLSYATHISKGSMFNTPPVFAVYTSMLTLRWLKENGGIAKAAEENEKKATLLYSEIDLNPLFKGYAAKEDRSIMNATFNLAEDNLKETFDTMLKEAGINGLNGHRSVGGYRASMYNALPLNSVGVLVDVMSELERKA
ncbi:MULTISPECIES: 3-phosphoserine/phosphohydroxythreonine transaminase [Leeuwenhoekiella]|jgi:phosphoserine aminotransferase|uniref:Phosphoserine aminotransferase n=1 Tax=Leeuwenhoekiella blandensis (strain CECT 7118 / CCUG 51940 / KCTC 22103 / MED217) TaxID=398720 RepID=A3XM21_LEEBM|nr:MULTISPECIES: 3-phosphoserine/phosphohydroxythreonine transaminase [Leeuwenhoekiella]EAQ49402.1 putative phosphoserine aminotransferase [Leeuwenhoekiella blandensis MED217]MAO44282.1 3-phosphoserine/phosphohydroxythreonine transaminase [Leeuwenhoekiella sp.]MBQ52919.1 3-phosphoserine/phosphohydroxythreonine transaminase [Leeuwenhoekiella sp.]HBT09201.1 3-phosphoserine/phosphohydroxythreonine transaminase [Leeuwenhoekiella sp.]HCW64482.1 3-phosphoserine/phosphohydroxythreonine transaminase [|tara:strand:- start:4376 stop:5440 length:1065 start_codon:yes stop_codon:yes gene_type:complete